MVERLLELEFAISLTDLANFVVNNPGCTAGIGFEAFKDDLQIILERLNEPPIILPFRGDT